MALGARGVNHNNICQNVSGIAGEIQLNAPFLPYLYVIWLVKLTTALALF